MWSFQTLFTPTHPAPTQFSNLLPAISLVILYSASKTFQHYFLCAVLVPSTNYCFLFSSLYQYECHLLKHSRIDCVIFQHSLSDSSHSSVSPGQDKSSL